MRQHIQMATTNLSWQNKFNTTLTNGVTASDTTIPLNSLPTPTEGYLVIEPDSSTAWEVIYYTSKTGSAVVCPSVGAGRGQGGSTAASHSSGATVRMDTVGEMFKSLQDGTGLADTSITPAKLQGGTGSSWAWQSWTPTWTNLTVGNATQACKYIQIGKTVHLRVSLTLGSTSSVGTTPVFSLPVTSVSMTLNAMIGVSTLVDAGTGIVQGFVDWQSTTTARPIATNGSYYGGMNASNPFIWSGANGDQILCTATYEAA